MTSPDAASHEPMDDFDLALLDGIRGLFEQADPMPGGLPERIKFSLAMRGMEAEVARLTAEDDSRLVAARGAEHSRTVTFDSESLTIMIRIGPGGKDMVRIDGWLAPAQPREIELQTAGGTQRAFSDDQGRFAFASVPRGTARLAVRAAEPGPAGPGRPVVTPALVL